MKLLGLTMIVKDEVHGLALTLDSFKPIIDHWTILDTGSTDGTQDLIVEQLKGLPGQLYQEPFVDFSTSRNRVLSLHGEQTLFTIMIDSDDLLYAESDIRSFLAIASTQVKAYAVGVLLSQTMYQLPLILKTPSTLKYQNRVHEFINVIAPLAPLIVQKKSNTISLAASKKRWLRDLVWLFEDLRDNPYDTRALFYVAQTYECLGDIELALKYYCKRSDVVTSWLEERFVATLRAGKLLVKLKRIDLAKATFERAIRMAPEYQEALVELAILEDDTERAQNLIKQAMSLPINPHRRLFIDTEWLIKAHSISLTNKQSQ